jgi:thiopurine S-methyltransferase
MAARAALLTSRLGAACGLAGLAGLCAGLGTGGAAECAGPARGSAEAERVASWTRRWDQYVRDKTKPGFHKSEVHERVLEFYPQLLTERPGRERILVPLCGKSLDMLFLAQFGPVAGVEVAQQAIDQFASDNELSYDQELLHESGGTLWRATPPQGGEPVTIARIDFFALPKGWAEGPEGSPASADAPKFTACWDRAAFIAIDPALRPAYARVLADEMAPSGKVLLCSIEYDQSRQSGPPWSLDEATVRRLCEPWFDITLLKEEENIDEAANAAWKQKGHTTLVEKTYLMVRNNKP